MKAFFKLAKVEFKLYMREPVAAFFTLLFPLMFLILFGAIYGNEPQELFGGYGTIDVSVPAYGAMIVGTTGLVNLPVFVCTYRERGILRRLKTTPVSPLTLLGAHSVVLFLITLGGMALLVIVGKIGYGLRFTGNALGVAGALFLSSLSLFATGFALASFSPTGRTAQVVSMIIFYPMLFLSGASLPRELLPENIQRLSQVLPLSHGVTILKGTWLGEPLSSFGREIGILLFVAFLGFALTVFRFRWE